MRLLPNSAYNNITLPTMYKVRQEFNSEHISDVESVVDVELSKPEIRSKVKSGMNVALLVGSRGIANIDRIVSETVRQLKAFGAKPVIIPSMGSHGGGTAKGQEDILRGYGITKETIGCEIYSSMEVVKTGEVDDVEIFADKKASECDLIIPIGRVKPHTDFRGNVESGLCKMLSIGIGKHIGCSSLHKKGFANFSWLIPQAAKVNMTALPVGFGIAIVENAYDETFLIEAVSAENIFTREPQLLKIAKNNMPKIRVRDIDLLIVNRIGKDVSGSGMDPNIIGRSWCGVLPGFDGPAIKRILVNGLTDKTHGNACGIGYADFATKDCIASVDWHATTVNAVTSGYPIVGKCPCPVDDEEEGIMVILASTPEINKTAPKIVKIESTLSLSEIQISESLLDEIKSDPNNYIID